MTRSLLTHVRLLGALSTFPLLAACGGDGAKSTGGDAAKTISGKYVAMGSSFAAGPRIPDTVPDQSCGRSTNNYAQLVAADLGLDLTDVSCSGATSHNVDLTPQEPNPLQLDAVTADTRVVTLTIGGNDVNYAYALGVCGLTGASGESCLTASGDAAAPLVDAAQIRDLLDQVGPRLVEMLGHVKEKAPDADIYLVSYPRILPDPATPCAPDAPLLPDDATFVGEVGTKLQAAFSSAAATAGVHFVDVYGPSQGHDVCADVDQRWVEGQATPDAAPYHPNARGMRSQADVIEAEIRKTF